MNHSREEASAYKRYMRERFISVYLIGSVSLGIFKIGVSYNPVARAKQLQSAFNVDLLRELVLERRDGLSLLKRARAIEKKLHAHYARYQMRGEWFANIGPHDFMNVALRFSDASYYTDGAHSNLRQPVEAQ